MLREAVEHVCVQLKSKCLCKSRGIVTYCYLGLRPPLPLSLHSTLSIQNPAQPVCSTSPTDCPAHNYINILPFSPLIVPMAQAQELDGKTILLLLDKHLFKPLAKPGANAEDLVRALHQSLKAVKKDPPTVSIF
jgi:hypothetical protein